jgi:hypothetical protein
MAGYRVELGGWKALAAIAAVLAVFGLRIYLRVQTVDDAGREAVRARLVKEYHSETAEQLKRKLELSNGGVPTPAEDPKIPDVQITAIAGHGTAHRMIVRAEITVDGGPPPDGRETRYFVLSCCIEDVGWYVPYESNEYSYRRALIE